MYPFPSFEPVHCSMSSSNCCFLTCIQVSQKAVKVLWYFHLFKNFPVVVIHTVKDFSIVNEAEVDVSLEPPCFLHDTTNVHNLISGSSASLKPSLYIWKFSIHILLKTSLKDFEHYLVSMWNEHTCTIVWILCHCLPLTFEWKVTFSSPLATAEFSKFADILSAAL